MKALTTSAAVLSLLTMGAVAMAQGSATTSAPVSAPAVAPAAPAAGKEVSKETSLQGTEKVAKSGKKAHKKH